MGIHVEHLSKRFGAFTAIDDVSFHVETGQLVALLGPSGGGKSTILRIIAGLDSADAGSVRFDGVSVDHLSARGRKVGFVFQHYALFRHMSVRENIEFGLRVQGLPAAERGDRSTQLMRLVGLTGMEARLPGQLSGGQRQRVALARALAPKPKLLLLDEPFAAVDAKVREELRQWVRALHEEVGVTSIFVTHDQHEAFTLADKVVVINHGRLEQVGTPLELMDSPTSEFVAGFIGEVNVLDGVMRGGKACAGSLSIPVEGHLEGAKVRLVVRSYDIKFWCADDGIASVRRMATFGDRVRVDADIDGGTPFFAQFPRRSSLLKGMVQGSRIAIEVTNARVFPL